MVKEVKPTAAITWKDIGFGPIAKRGRPIALLDCPPEKELLLEEGERYSLDGQPAPGGDDQPLRSVYIDTGEGGLFSIEEFTAITTLGRMEAVTPEDIARTVINELRGVAIGRDILSAMDGAVIGPSYRAGVMRQTALTYAGHLAAQHGADSVAFEILGPPKLSKLLFETFFLEQALGTMAAIAGADAGAIVDAVADLVTTRPRIRQQAVSVGILILMADGKTLLCVDTGQPEQRRERLN